MFNKLLEVIFMPTDTKFTFRTKKNIIDKIMYIAQKECRTTSKEIEYLVLKKIAEYEEQYGEIVLEQKK